MASTEWLVLGDLEAFRNAKAGARGVIAIRGTGTMIHHPDCPHVREDSFIEKLANGRVAYFWAASPEVVRRRWNGARTCGHPSDPLNGGLGGPEASRPSPAVSGARHSTSWEIDGPHTDLRAVRAYVDTPLPYEPKTDEQRELRAELRKRLQRLVTGRNELLQASYFGPKPTNADVENILLYNVDDSARCFVGGRTAVRFEWSPDALPRSPRPCAYVYRPASERSDFTLWTADVESAAKLHAELDKHPANRLDAWLALRTGRVEIPGTPMDDTPVAVSVTLHPPAGSTSVSDGATRLVKPVLDALIGALQADPEAAANPIVATRLAAMVGISPERVSALLADDSRAVLGSIRHLVRPWGNTLQLTPSDERCVAGTIVIGSPSENGQWQVHATVAPVKLRRRSTR